MWDDGNKLGPFEIHNYLNRVMYNRRNKFDPLWNSLVLGGIKKGKKYLGMVCHALWPCLHTSMFCPELLEKLILHLVYVEPVSLLPDSISNSFF